MNNENTATVAMTGAVLDFTIRSVKPYFHTQWSPVPLDQLNEINRTGLIYLSEEHVYYVPRANRVSEILQLPEGEVMDYERLSKDTEYAYKRDRTALYYVLVPRLNVYRNGQLIGTYYLTDPEGYDTIEFDYSQEYDGYTPKEKLEIMCLEQGIIEDIESLGFDIERILISTKCLEEKGSN